MKLDHNYWQNRYENLSTGWDLGAASPPITAYVDSLANKEISILIPGAGNAHEADYLWGNGFKNTTILDLAQAPLQSFKKAHPNFPKNQLVQSDFFEHVGNYDLIIEQTFFCALEPRFRESYPIKMKELLKPHGKLVGLLFEMDTNGQGPPFGGDRMEYQKLFEPHFKIKRLESCYNSVPQRSGKELFLTLEKQ